MRKSLLTAVSAAALISAGTVSPTFAQSNSETTEPVQSETQVTPAPADGTTGSGDAMQSETADPAKPDAAMDSTTPTDSENADMKSDMRTTDEAAVTGDGDEMDVAQPAGTYMASDLTGEPVQNGDGEDLADIDDFVIDEGGQITHVIVSFGGFLGLGDKEVMLPWDQIQITTDPDDPDDPDEHIAMLSMTKDEIEALPEFKTQEEVQDEAEAARPADTTGTGTGMGTTGTGTTGTTAQ